MNKENEQEMLDLLTRPMSETELSQYQEFMDSDGFQTMLRAYHTQAALDAARQVVSGFFTQHPLSYEVMLMALTGIWLDNLGKLDKQFDKQMIGVWMHSPVALCQVLLQFAIDALNDKAAEVREDYPPELEELYVAWKKFLPKPQANELNPSPEMLQQANIVLEAMESFQAKLEQDPDLRLQAEDYLDVWTHVILQTYIFGSFEKAEFYFLLSHNWQCFIQTMPTVLRLLLMLRGYEELLLPENRDKLNNLMQDKQVQDVLVQRYVAGQD